MGRSENAGRARSEPLADGITGNVPLLFLWKSVKELSRRWWTEWQRSYIAPNDNISLWFQKKKREGRERGQEGKEMKEREREERDYAMPLVTKQHFKEGERKEGHRDRGMALGRNYICSRRIISHQHIWTFTCDFKQAFAYFCFKVK